MSKKLVSHPRFTNPEPGCEVTIKGDITKQNATDAVYAYFDSYTDALKKCCKCNRPFYFFAREQKYWYEKLGFWVDTESLYCFECRLIEHKVKQLQKEYELLQKIQVPKLIEIKRFRVVAKVLLKLGCMKDINKVNKLG